MTSWGLFSVCINFSSKGVFALCTDLNVVRNQTSAVVLSSAYLLSKHDR